MVLLSSVQGQDYSGGHTLDDLIEYVEKQMAGVSDKDDDESDFDNEGELGA